jgi:hypothetical protein
MGGFEIGFVVESQETAVADFENYYRRTQN